MEEFYVFGGYCGGFVGIVGFEGGGEQLGVGLVDLCVQGVGGCWCGNEVGGQ